MLLFHNAMSQSEPPITIGVLALQGAFSEHTQLLHRAASQIQSRSAAAAAKPNDEPTTTSSHPSFNFLEVRTPEQLHQCDALILPGGESTTISLVAQRSQLLEPLRSFVKVQRKPVWGTCAGLILLSESANKVKRGGQELIGGLDVRVNRNHFGRQTESFEVGLNLPFLDDEGKGKPFHSVFIRAPVVEKILPHKSGAQDEEARREEMIVAPSRAPADEAARAAVRREVEVMARLPGAARAISKSEETARELGEEGDIIA
ncbi:hypothetical protein LTS18_010062, partial [Coniosporium uncinatum]